jgi:hypothetical protein
MKWELRTLAGVSALIAGAVFAVATGIAAAMGEFNRTMVANIAVGAAVVLLVLAVLSSGLLRFNLHPMDPMYSSNLTAEYMLAQQEHASGRLRRSWGERFGPAIVLTCAASLVFVVAAFLGE